MGNPGDVAECLRTALDLLKLLNPLLAGCANDSYFKNVSHTQISYVVGNTKLISKIVNM
jgi:hypothetical protein